MSSDQPQTSQSKPDKRLFKRLATGPTGPRGNTATGSYLEKPTQITRDFRLTCDRSWYHSPPNSV